LTGIKQKISMIEVNSFFIDCIDTI
jgi:hypothetical protein